MVQTRPPTRSRASTTVTEAPIARRSNAAVRPASPPPAISTETPERLGLCGLVGTTLVVTSLELRQLIALGFQHRDEAVWSNEMRRTDDDEGMARTAEQG